MKKEKIKVLFLDIDGVVNCSSTYKKSEYWPLDQYMAFLVGKIVLDTDCKVVLSSSWRHHNDGTKEVEKRICKLLDTTSDIPRPTGNGVDFCQRGKEINAWLKNNENKYNIIKYAILDDDRDFLPGQPLFKTSWETGLTKEIADEVIKYLNN